jgi:hypothetical protein
LRGAVRVNKLLGLQYFDNHPEHIRCLLFVDFKRQVLGQQLRHDLTQAAHNVLLLRFLGQVALDDMEQPASSYVIASHVVKYCVENHLASVFALYFAEAFLQGF